MDFILKESSSLCSAAPIGQFPGSRWWHPTPTVRRCHFCVRGTGLAAPTVGSQLLPSWSSGFRCWIRLLASRLLFHLLRQLLLSSLLAAGTPETEPTVHFSRGPLHSLGFLFACSSHHPPTPPPPWFIVFRQSHIAQAKLPL